MYNVGKPIVAIVDMKYKNTYKGGTMKKPWLIGLGILGVISIWIFSSYNGLVQTEEQVNGQWAQVQTQLQRRSDLIPNLVSTVKGYATHEKETIQAKMEELTHLRESKQPLEYPSCGSVFKRPEGHFTGKLIQDAGLQGFQIGGAQVSKKHAGFIVNIDHATATDYLAVIQHVQEVVFEQFQVRLEPEVKIIGEESK